MTSHALQTGASSRSDVLELLHVEVAGHRCAFPLAIVVEIHPAVRLAPLPDAPDVVVGLMNRRGDVLPVLDLRRRLGLPVRPLQVQDHLVVLRAAEREVALVVDVAVDIGSVPTTAVDTAVAAATQATYSSGAVGLPDGLLVVLDAATFLAPGEVLALDSALLAVSQAAPP